MKLLGRDIPARELMTRIEERLRLRGLPTSEAVEVPAGGVEPRVEPLTFNLHALEENADATRALPLHTHRGGAGQLVLVAKWAFRKSCQVFINETLGRQRVFNGHVRDAYAQLSAEVIRLRREVEELRARQGVGPSGGERRPAPAQASPTAKAAPSGRAVEERQPAAKPASSHERTPRTGELPSIAEPATSASSAPATKSPPTRRNAPSAKKSSGRKPASNRKPAGGSGALVDGEPVLPRPRHARSAEGQPPPPREGAPRVRPQTEGAGTPTTGKAGQRPRKPAPRRRGRRK